MFKRTVEGSELGVRVFIDGNEVPVTEVSVSIVDL